MEQFNQKQNQRQQELEQLRRQQLERALITDNFGLENIKSRLERENTPLSDRAKNYYKQQLYPEVEANQKIREEALNKVSSNNMQEAYKLRQSTLNFRSHFGPKKNPNPMLGTPKEFTERLSKWASKHEASKYLVGIRSYNDAVEKKLFTGKETADQLKKNIDLVNASINDYNILLYPNERRPAIEAVNSILRANEIEADLIQINEAFDELSKEHDAVVKISLLKLQKQTLEKKLDEEKK